MGRMGLGLIGFVDRIVSTRLALAVVIFVCVGRHNGSRSGVLTAIHYRGLSTTRFARHCAVKSKLKGGHLGSWMATKDASLNAADYVFPVEI